MHDNQLLFIFSKQLELSRFLIQIKEWELSLFQTEDEIDLEKLATYLCHEHQTLDALSFWKQQEADARHNFHTLSTKKNKELNDELNINLSHAQEIDQLLHQAISKTQSFYQNQISSAQIFKEQRIPPIFTNDSPSLIDISC